MSESCYREIAELIDQNPLGAPKEGGDFAPAFMAYLELLYTPEEAELVRHFNPPISLSPKYFLTAAQVAEAAGRNEEEARRILDDAAAKGAIVGLGGAYALPTVPLLVNAHQFAEEVGPDDLEASRLYQDYFVKGGFYKYYESSEAGTPLMRVIPVMRTIEYEQKVLDFEEAHRIIDACENLSLVPCPCRTRTEKMDVRECKDKYPVGACIMTELSALYFQARGLGRKVTAGQARQYLDEMQDLGLVALTDNYSDPRHSVICLCCDCCCSQVRGRTRWDNPDALAPSNFVPVASEDCVACGICVDRCFFGALSIEEGEGRSVVDPDKCIGCGVCTITCDQEALKLHRLDRAEPPEKPRDLFKKVAAENRGGN
jgi:ferredoxin